MVISIPEVPSPALNGRRNLIFMDNKAMEPPNSVVPKVAGKKNNTSCCLDKGVVLAKGGGG